MGIRKRIVVLVLPLLLVIFASYAQSGPSGCTNPTVVDGYVQYANGSDVGAGFNVSVSVSGPSTCNSFSDLTDSNGYYAIAGLDIQNNPVSASTTVNTYSASNSSTPSTSTLRLNLMPVPAAPSLTAVSDRHNGTDIVFTWTSGTIPDNAATFDEWQLVGVSTDNSSTSPKTANVSGFATYTWRARTCYTGFSLTFCSSYSSDSFDVENTAPTAPAQTDQSNTHDTFVNLTWTSGTDSDTLPTDSLVDEFYFDDDSNPLSSPLQQNLSIPTGTHTFNVSGLTLGTTYYWMVRTCDNTFASNNCTASTDSFTISNTAPSVPIIEEFDKTDNSSQLIRWVSGVDPEGDTVTDEFQLANDSGFGASSLLVNNTAASSPQTVSLPDFDILWWRVRSCDEFGECSSYNSSIFQKYTCEGVGDDDDDDDDDDACPTDTHGTGASFTTSTGLTGTGFRLDVVGATPIEGTVAATLAPGEQVRRQIRARNIGNNFLSVDLSTTGVSDYLLFSTNRLQVDPGEFQTADVTVRVPEGLALGVYAGSIVGVSGDLEETLPVVIAVVSDAADFDIELILTERDRRIETPSPSAQFYLPIRRHTIYPQISLEEITGTLEEEVEVLVTYEVRDLDNNLLYTESETIAVLGQKSYTKELTLPRDIGIGEYVLSAILDHDGKKSVSSQTFEITATNYEDLIKEVWPIAAATAFVLLIGGHLWLLRHRSKLRKPKHPSRRNLYQKEY